MISSRGMLANSSANDYFWGRLVKVNPLRMRFSVMSTLKTEKNVRHEVQLDCSPTIYQNITRPQSNSPRVSGLLLLVCLEPKWEWTVWVGLGKGERKEQIRGFLLLACLVIFFNNVIQARRRGVRGFRTNLLQTGKIN